MRRRRDVKPFFSSVGIYLMEHLRPTLKYTFLCDHFNLHTVSDNYKRFESLHNVVN